MLLLTTRSTFDMSSELKAHRREHLPGKVVFATRSKPLMDRGAEHRRRRAFVDRCGDGPTSFAGIRHMAGEAGQVRLFQQSIRRQVQQPRCDHAAAAPYLGDVSQIKVVLIMLWIPQRRSLSVDSAPALTGVC